MIQWIKCEDRLPEVEGYCEVKFADGTTDEKPFRIRPSKNIKGFMTMEEVTHWRPLPTTGTTYNTADKFLDEHFMTEIQMFADEAIGTGMKNIVCKAMEEYANQKQKTSPLEPIPVGEEVEKWLLNLIDITWNEANEDKSVPSTKWAKEILFKAGYKATYNPIK